MRKFSLSAILFFQIGYPPYAWTQDPPDKGMLKIHLDMRTTLSEGKRLRMGGASVGWEWGKNRHETTLGYYWTGNRGRNDLSRLQNLTITTLPTTETMESDLRFLNAGYWLTIKDWPRWKISTPLEIGVGRGKFTSQSNGEMHVERVQIFPLQAAVYGEWKATRWLGLGSHVGYRHYLSSQNHSSLAALNGMYYRFRVLLYIQTYYDWRDFLFRDKPLASPFYKKSKENQ